MHWLNRILVAALIAGVVAYGPDPFVSVAASNDLDRVRHERAALAEANAKLEREIRLLRAEVAALQDDPSEIARIAREDLNLVMPGEVVFEVVRPQEGG